MCLFRSCNVSLTKTSHQRIVLGLVEEKQRLYKWCSCEDVRSLATGGIFGKQAGALKPLKVDELQQELIARSVPDTTMKK